MTMKTTRNNMTLALPQTGVVVPKPTQNEVIEAMAVLRREEIIEEMKRLRRDIEAAQEELDRHFSRVVNMPAEVHVHDGGITVRVEFTNGNMSSVETGMVERFRKLNDSKRWREPSLEECVYEVRRDYKNMRLKAMLDDKEFMRCAKNALMMMEGNLLDGTE